MKTNYQPMDPCRDGAGAGTKRALRDRLPPQIHPSKFKDRSLMVMMDYARKIHLAYAAGRRDASTRQWDQEWAQVYGRVIAAITALPELLEVLEAVLDDAYDGSGLCAPSWETVEPARAALAKWKEIGR